MRGTGIEPVHEDAAIRPSTRSPRWIVSNGCASVALKGAENSPDNWSHNTHTRPVFPLVSTTLNCAALRRCRASRNVFSRAKIPTGRNSARASVRRTSRLGLSSRSDRINDVRPRSCLQSRLGRRERTGQSSWGGKAAEGRELAAPVRPRQCTFRIAEEGDRGNMVSRIDECLPDTAGAGRFIGAASGHHLDVGARAGCGVTSRDECAQRPRHRHRHTEDASDLACTYC
jgi:hypothetical protein